MSDSSEEEYITKSRDSEWRDVYTNLVFFEDTPEEPLAILYEPATPLIPREGNRVRLSEATLDELDSDSLTDKTDWFTVDSVSFDYTAGQYSGDEDGKEQTYERTFVTVGIEVSPENQEDE